MNWITLDDTEIINENKDSLGRRLSAKIRCKKLWRVPVCFHFSDTKLVYYRIEDINGGKIGYIVNINI